jgi:hypothetical protein
MLREINACTEPAKIPNSIIGNGITKGTNDVNVTVNSSAKMFPNNQTSDKFRKIF